MKVSFYISTSLSAVLMILMAQNSDVSWLHYMTAGFCIGLLSAGIMEDLIS